MPQRWEPPLVFGGVLAVTGCPLSGRGSGSAKPGRVGSAIPRGSAARWEQWLPVPHRNMALLWGLLVLSLSCLQGSSVVVSLGLGLGGAGSQVGKRQGSGQEKEGAESGEGLALRGFPLLSSSFSQQFSPASAMEPLDQQVLGRERHEGEEGPEGPHLWLPQGWGNLWEGSRSICFLPSSANERADPGKAAPAYPPQVGQPGTTRWGWGKGGRGPREEGQSAGARKPGGGAMRRRPEDRGWETPEGRTRSLSGLCLCDRSSSLSRQD